MSRSYKHSEVVKDKNAKYMKRFANKKARKTDLPKHGKAYKKCFESWRISDYSWFWSKEEAIEQYNKARKNSYIKTHYKTLEEYLIYWEKCTKRK